MLRLPALLAACITAAIFVTGTVVSAKASLDEAAREHDQAVAERLPKAVESTFETRGISLASSSIDPSSLDTEEPPMALEYPASRLSGNNCFAISFYEAESSPLPGGSERVSCQEILRQRVRPGAPRTRRGTLVGDHYVVLYSLTPRMLRMVKATLREAVRADR